jgi:nucleoside 2-deoxyribosyltransferase
MKIFFGGIIQGSKQGQDIHSQNYRDRVKSFIVSRYPDIEIFDPVENHENSIEYSDEKAYATFFKHLDIIDNCDLMIAYLPSASMGTAIEMNRAYDRNIPILSISPMTTNWVIRLLAENNFETVEAFEKFITENDIRDLFDGRKSKADNVQETA